MCNKRKVYISKCPIIFLGCCNINSALYTRISGSGIIKGSGKVKDLHSSITGSGKVLDFQVMANFFGTITGSGRINVDVAKKCSVRQSVTGSGKITINEELSNFKGWF